MRSHRSLKLFLGLATMAGTLSLAPAVNAASLSLAPVAASAKAASVCNRLQIPSVGINRCVVSGTQKAIDAGQVVRYSPLSGGGRDWIAAHRTSHGGSFRNLTGVKIGAKVVWKGRTYQVAQHQVVDRRQPGKVASWGPLVLQTSKSGAHVYVWRLTPA